MLSPYPTPLAFHSLVTSLSSSDQSAFFCLWAFAHALPTRHPQPQSLPQGNLNKEIFPHLHWLLHLTCLEPQVLFPPATCHNLQFYHLRDYLVSDSLSLDHDELPGEEDCNFCFYFSLYLSIQLSVRQNVGAQWTLTEWIHLWDELTEQRNKSWAMTSQVRVLLELNLLAWFYATAVASHIDPLSLTGLNEFRSPPKPKALTPTYTNTTLPVRRFPF